MGSRLSMIKRVIEHASSTPHHPAIQTSQTTLTYQQLYEDVCLWRDFFASQPLSRVVVALDRTPRLIAVLLALQWLRITYIPVDTNMPAERLRYVIENSQADAFLYDTVLTFAPNALPCRTYDLRAPLPQGRVKKRKPASLAYIIYTSGSTGTPKGVGVSYKALHHFLSVMSETFLREKEALFLAISTLAFDIAGLELYLPLWQGKTIFLSSMAEYRDPAQIKQLLMQHPITHLQATPTMWRLIEEAGFAGNPALQALCGGERLPEALAKTLLPKVKALWNLYGPTEATIWCAYKKIEPETPVTIGHPIQGMQMCVLDKNLHPLPPYVKGELYITGTALAEGYINNKALTKERFIRRGIRKRLYRTGDIASTTKEGEFLVFGRCDNQIKLHGYRIELEEIEAQLASVPNVRACAVTVYNEGLVAYVCPKSASFSEAKAVKQLQAVLPEYMIPSQWIILKKMPQMLSGKVDRKSLPLPSIPGRNREGAEIKQPLADARGSDTEKRLKNIWLEVFKLEQIDTRRSFFDLGGHSLLAAQMISQIRTQFQKELSLKEVYHAQTIEKLATLIEATPKKTGTIPLPVIKHKRWLPLNDFQRLLWGARLFEPAIKKLNVAARKRIQGPLDKAALDLALKIVYEKHEAFSYTLSRFLPIQRKRKRPPVGWIETSLIHMDKETAEAELDASFDSLYHDTPWRKNQAFLMAKLFYLQDDCLEIQLCMPHIIADETSGVLLVDDLSHLYLLATQGLPLVPLSQSFAYSEDAKRQHAYTQQYDARDAKFWKRYLKGVELLHLPENYKLQTVGKSFAYSTYIPIPEENLTQLRLFCEKNLVTLSETLCAASVLSLKKILPTLPQKMVINVVKSTRYDAESEKSIGCFLQNQLCKLHLKKRNPLSSLSKAVQHSILESQAHQQASSLVKFSAMRHVFKPSRSLSSNCIRLALKILEKVAPLLKMDVGMLQACQKMVGFKRDRFLLQINIFPHFLTPKKDSTYFGAPCVTIPNYKHDILKVPYQLDITFLRDDAGKAYVVISANLAPAYRKKLGEGLLDVMRN